jgi:hypothetical protein
MNLSDWRHIAIDINRVLIQHPEQSKSLQNAFALQAGHSEEVAGRLYALSRENVYRVGGRT